MRRREFITLLGGAAAWPLAARAQQSERVRRIGVLTNLAADDPEGQVRNTAFAQALAQLGWTVGHNLRIEQRWAASDRARITS
jgi:putative ABC transport system substrate-binding protein